MNPSTPTAPAREAAPMPPRRALAPPISSLDDGALVRRALELHALNGEIPRGIPARIAALLGISRSGVCRAGAGANVQLSVEARKLLETHVADPAARPLPPGSELRGRPRADAPPLDPDRRHSRGGGRIGPPHRESASRVAPWLTAEEEEQVRELANEQQVVPGRIIAGALESYAGSPDPSPPAPPEGARRCRWMAGAKAIRRLDKAIGRPRGRREHVRAAVLRLLAAGEKKIR